MYLIRKIKKKKSINGLKEYKMPFVKKAGILTKIFILIYALEIMIYFNFNFNILKKFRLFILFILLTIEQ